MPLFHQQSFSVTSETFLVTAGSLTTESGLGLGGGTATDVSALLSCPLECGLQPVGLPFLRSHLVAFHGCEPDSIKVTSSGKVRRRRNTEYNRKVYCGYSHMCYTGISTVHSGTEINGFI